MEKLKENKGLVIFPPRINMKSQRIMREFSLGLFSRLVRFVWIGSMVVANNDFDDLCQPVDINSDVLNKFAMKYLQSC